LHRSGFVTTRLKLHEIWQTGPCANLSAIRRQLINLRSQGYWGRPAPSLCAACVSAIRFADEDALLLKLAFGSTIAGT